MIYSFCKHTININVSRFHFFPCLIIIIICWLSLLSTSCGMTNQSTDKLQCLQWNCRSKNNFDYLKDFLVCNSFHVIALQSLNCKRSVLPKLDGYFFPPVIDYNYFHNKVQVATYFSCQTDYTVVKSPAFSKKSRLYSCCASIDLENTKLNVVNCYYPEGVSKGDADWLENLENSKDWIIMGDFNAHHILWEIDSVCYRQNSHLANVITQSPLSLLNDGSITRIADRNDQNSSAIDLTLISPKFLLLSCWSTVQSPLGSDHLPIIILINSSPKLRSFIKTGSKYVVDKADWSKFQKSLESSCGMSINYENANLEETYHQLRTAIIKAADDAIPKSEPSASTLHPKVKRNPWWNIYCKEAVKSKTRAFKAWIKSRKNNNAEVTRNLHNQYKKENINCNRVIAYAKQQYFKSYITDKVHTCKDTVKLWKEVAKMKGIYNLPEPSLTTDTGDVNSAQDKSEVFVKLFSKVSNSDSLPEVERNRRQTVENEFLHEHEMSVDNKEEFFNHDLTMQELNFALKSIKGSKVATGKDPISYVMMKHFPDAFKEILLRFFQLCWKCGKIPKDWKEAVVIPIHKPGKPKKNPSSYRPIALTPHLGKLFERIVKNRLEHFCDKNNIIPIFQAGFRKGRGVTDHTVRLASHIKKGLARRHSTLATFYDIHKAYDSVWHFKLLSKLKKIGVGGNLYNFIKDFLSGRSIQVRVRDILSGKKYVDMGVPQGSVISPLLFSIMLHDIKEVDTDKSYISLYADDIALWETLPYNFNKNKKKREKSIKKYQESVNKIILYLNLCGFSLSADKTVFVIFTRQNIAFTGVSASYILVNGVHIYPSKTAKFLGIIFHYKLLWHSHITYITEKARKKFSLIKVLSGEHWANNGKNLVHIALAVVRSVLSYGKEVYFSAPKSDLHKIVSIDTMALKLALGLPRWASISLTYKEAGVLPILDNNLLLTSKYVVKAKQNKNSVSDVLDESILVCKKIKNKYAYQSIHDYIFPLFKDFDFTSRCSNLSENVIHPYPPWLLEPAHFWYSYSPFSKNENANIIAETAKEIISTRFQSYFKIYTDGSVNVENHVGAAFVIPEFNICKRYSLPVGSSIFAAELVAILTALSFVSSMPSPPLRVLILSDSKSSLVALDSIGTSERPELINEIRYLIHQLVTRGSDVQLLWVPSHTSLRGNHMADSCAKEAARGLNSQTFVLKPSVSEIFSKLKNAAWEKWKTNYMEQYSDKNHWDFSCPSKHYYVFPGSIPEKNMFHRLRTNSWLGRYLRPSPLCSCGQNLDINHLVFNCEINSDYFSVLLDNLNTLNLPISLKSVLMPLDENNWTFSLLLIRLIKGHQLGRYF